MIRCDWVMPENSLITDGIRCVKYADHGVVHVVAINVQNSVTFWQINTRKRTIQAVLHVDLQDRADIDENECLTLYHSLKTMRSAS